MWVSIGGTTVCIALPYGPNDLPYAGLEIVPCLEPINLPFQDAAEDYITA